MKSDKLQFFEQVVEDLTPTGVDFTGTCPSCGRPSLRLAILGPDEFDPTCHFCTPAQIRDAVRAEIIARRVPKNGTQGPPTPRAGSTPEPNAMGGFCRNVVSVLGRSESKKPPDSLEAEAYHGLAGEVMRTIEPHTESHPAAILASFLTGVGCLIGRGPNVFRDGGRHGCNEFALLVGPTARGRKGTGTRRVDEIFMYSSSDDTDSTESARHDARGTSTAWRDLVVTGLGSGEALVSALTEETGSGLGDPRRMVFAGEFSHCLKVMRRENSTLSEILRAAWDSEALQSRTKGKTLRADLSHVSIMGHITESELRERMGQTELFNGFANRFLWFATRRVRSLPFGGGKVPLNRIVRQLQEALQKAPFLGPMEFDDDAKTIWGDGGVYDLLTDRPANLFGAVTSRAESHVTRLALIYAVLDRSPEIRVPHLLAGLAVWDYSERTCAYLFSGSSGDSYTDLILEMLLEIYPGALTRTELRDKFGRNAQAGRIPASLALLEEEGKAKRTRSGTGGRPVEYWSAAVITTSDQNDKTTKAPLFVARRLAAEIGYTTETT